MSPHPAFQQNVPLGGRTSLKTGGLAEWYAELSTTAEARAAMKFARERGLDFTVIGGGSNLLIADEGLAGLSVRFPAGRGHSIEDGQRGWVDAAAGSNLAGLARRLARAGWSGLEWAANVPGTVGGAIVNNAGAFGSSVAECLERATLLLDDGSCVELTQQDLGYAYRSSVLKRGELGRAVVLDGRFRLARGPVEVTLGQVRTFQSQRTETQPRQLSAGSVFANPADDYAGRLIEAACLKGLRRGPAEISRQHANFIVNRGGASSRQVYELMRTAQESVWQKFGVWLRPEIQLIGRWPPRDVAALEGPEEAR